MKPKYLKKKKASGFGWILTGIVLLVIAAVVLMSVFSDDREDAQVSDPQDTGNSVTENSETPDEATTEATLDEVKGTLGLLEFKNGEIHTPYLTLYYPESFEDYLLVANSCEDPYILEFYAVLPDRMELRIFDVCLGEGASGNLGVVTTEAGEVRVSMTLYSFTPDDTWEAGEIDTVLAMQEAANELIDCLGLSDNGSSPDYEDAPADTPIVNYMQFETPYCVLHYPAIWADWLCVEYAEHGDAYTVEFYCSLDDHEPLLMFTVLFGGDEGEQLGVVTNEEGMIVPVNILMNTPSEEGLQEEERNILYSMQEALNLLIQQLPLQ